MLYILGLLLLSCLETNGREDFQEFLDQTKKDFKIQGLTIGAFKDNDWVLRGQIGTRNAEDAEQTPIGADDQFPLTGAGSPIVAMLVARIVERSVGDVTWNTTIQEVLGDTMAMLQPYANVSLYELVTWQGWTPDIYRINGREDRMEWYDSLWESSQWENAEQNKLQRLGLTQYLVNWECTPGYEDQCDKATFSPFSLTVAITLLEAVTDKTFDALLIEEVFEPLGALGCGVGPNTLDNTLPPSQPWNHFSGPWGKYNIPIHPGNKSSMPSSMAPDFGIHCSMDSWKIILASYLAKNESFLSPESWKTLFDPAYNTLGAEYMAIAPGIVILYERLAVMSKDDGKSYALVELFPGTGTAIILAANSNMQEGMRQFAGMMKIICYTENILSEELGIPEGICDLVFQNQ